MPGTLKDNESTVVSTAVEVYSNSAVSERGCGVGFTAGSSYTIGECQFYLQRFGSPTGNLSFQLFTTTAGLPTALVSESTTKINVATISTTATWYPLTLSAYSVASGTFYSLMCARPSSGDAYTGDGANYIRVYGTGSDSDGTRTRIIRSSVDVYTSGAGDDVSFKIYDAASNIRQLALLGVG